MSLTRLEAQLYSRNRVVGARSRREAIAELVAMQDAAAARMLAEAVVRLSDEPLRKIALQTLYAWSLAVMFDSVRAVWKVTGHADLLQLVVQKQLVQDGLADSAENRLRQIAALLLERKRNLWIPTPDDDAQWDTVVQKAVQDGNRQLLWRLIERLPPVQSVSILVHLADPLDQSRNRHLFERLLAHAQQCAAFPLPGRWVVAHTLPPIPYSFYEPLSFSHDGQRLFGVKYASLLSWQVEQDLLVQQSTVRFAEPIFALGNDGQHVWSGESTTAIFYALNPPFEKIFEIDDHAKITARALSADQQHLFAGDTNGYIHVWDIASQRHSGRYFVGADKIEVLATSPDGKLLASYSKGRLTLWRLPMMKQVRIIDRSVESEYQLCFTLDSKGLIVMQSSLIDVYDVPSGRLRWSAPDKAMKSSGWYTQIELTPDGQAVAAMSNTELIFYELGRGQVRARYPAQLQSIAFHPQQKIFAVNHDTHIQLWRESNLYQLLHKPLIEWGRLEQQLLDDESARLDDMPQNEWGHPERNELASQMRRRWWRRQPPPLNKYPKHWLAYCRTMLQLTQQYDVEIASAEAFDIGIADA